MNINITIQKIKILLDNILTNKLSLQDFIYIIKDIYTYEIENYVTKNDKEDDLYYILQTYDGDIHSYSPDKNAQKLGYINEEQLYERTQELLNELNKYIKDNNIKEKYEIVNDIRNKKVVHLIQMLLKAINKYSFFQKINLLEDIRNIINQLKYIKNKSRSELELEKDIVKIYRLSKIIYIKQKIKFLFSIKIPALYNLIFPPLKDPLSERDMFWMKVNDLKENLYFYLNPELKESK